MKYPGQSVVRLSLTVVMLGLSHPVVGQAPTADYWVYVGAESADLVHLVRFGPDGAEVAKTIPVGESPVETEGPHGLRMSPDGAFLYMTTGHGIPDGKLWKFEAGADTLVAQPILLGYFPATIELTPDGLYAFVVNFNLHGEHVPSTVSVVYTPSMIEIEQIVTCIMPHGVRAHPAGDRVYSACMMDDQLVEIDTHTFEVARRFSVATGHEGPLPEVALGHGDGGSTGDMPNATCSPTWAQPDPTGAFVYVACNRADVILEIAVDDWQLTRRFSTGRGPYNLAVTSDGRTLVATLKQGASVELIDLESATSLGVMPSSTTVTHGVEVTPDGRYGFVSVEGVGAEPGKVDVFDLQQRVRVASVEVGQQAGGIVFWKMETR